MLFFHVHGAQTCLAFGEKRRERHLLQWRSGVGAGREGRLWSRQGPVIVTNRMAVEKKFLKKVACPKVHFHFFDDSCSKSDLHNEIDKCFKHKQLVFN